MNKKGMRWGMLILGYAFLYIPLSFVIIFSFNSARDVYSWESFSLKWYRLLFQNGAILESLGNSLKIACISATFSAIIGTFAAFSLVRLKKFKGRGLFETMVNVPLIIPEVVTGLSLLLFFVSVQQLIGISIPYGIPTISIAHITLGIAYVVIIVRSRLAEIDVALEEAAMDLGARPQGVFFKVILPLVAPACLGGWFLSFALSFDDVVIASFLSSPESTTLPMVIFSTIRLGGMSPQINALATVMLGITTLLVIIAGVVTYHRSRLDTD